MWTYITLFQEKKNIISGMVGIPSSATLTPPLSSLFVRDRCSSSTFQRFLLYAYVPFGILLFCLRVIIGVHIFLTACVLRKTMLLRCTVSSSFLTHLW